MSSWKGKTRGGLTGYRIFLFLLRNFNIRAAYFLLYFVAMYYVLLAGKARKPMYYYFNKIHRFSTLKTYYYLYLNNLTFGKIIIDKVVLMAGLPNKFSFKFEGENYLQDMAKGEGGLIIGAHIGNWEIAGHLLKRISKPVHIVMIDAEYQRIKNLLDNVMTEKKMNIINISEDMSHLFKIREALLANEIVAIHGDRFLSGSKKITCSFMGENAEFPTGPFYIAMKYKKPVSFVSATKISNSNYLLTATKPTLYPNSGKLDVRKKTLKQMLKDYISQIEITLKMHPEQWFNYYYFWDKNQ
jgi:predicted LPLAT superfamily acyltransferase